MALTKRLTRKIDIPHEPGEHLTIRQLGWRDLEAARQAQQRAAMRNVKDMGGDVLKVLRDARGQAEIAQADADPLTAYDLGTLLHFGITGWSYTDDEGKPVPVTPDTIDQLDEKTARWAALAIVGADEAEAAAKNGAGGLSTEPLLETGLLQKSSS